MKRMMPGAWWLGLLVALLPCLAEAARGMNAQQLPPYIERPTDAAGVFAIWPGNGVPPGAESWDWHEQAMAPPSGMGSTLMVRNVVVPTLTMFAPAHGSGDTAIIVAPGGA